MPDPVFQPSKEWKGAFIWDGYFLRVHIRTVMVSYNRNDPQAWPIITDLAQTENGRDYRCSKIPPAFLAYSQELMKDMLKTGPMERNSKKHTIVFTIVKLYDRFRNYPLNFDMEGTLRQCPHIFPHELVVWRKLVVGLDAIKVEENSSPLGAENASREMGAAGNISSAKAYANIMKTLTKASTPPQAEIAELQEKLGKSMESLHEERDRAANAKELQAKLKKELQAKLKKELQAKLKKELQVTLKKARKEALHIRIGSAMSPRN